MPALAMAVGAQPVPKDRPVAHRSPCPRNEEESMSPLAAPSHTPALAVQYAPRCHRRSRHCRPAALCLLVFAGGSGPVAADVLRIGFAGRVTSLDPHFFVGPANQSAAMHVFDRLVHRAPDGILQPWLATSWQAVGDTVWE